MKIRFGTMFLDVFKALFSKPATIPYPFTRKPAPSEFRGIVEWNEELCIGCMMCDKDCPSNAIDFIVLDRKEKRFVMNYRYDICTYCAQCVASCRPKAVSLNDEAWENASLDKSVFNLWYGSPENVAEAKALRAKEKEEAEAAKKAESEAVNA